MTDSPRHFAVCIRNEEHEESLELCKIYEVLDDPRAAARGMCRIVDEEGEGYLYPTSWFMPIELPHRLEEAIVQLSAGR